VLAEGYFFFAIVRMIFTAVRTMDSSVVLSYQQSVFCCTD
jgi:hypothetical protein